MKLAWGVPRRCHNYFVENVLSYGLPQVRQRILGQYLGFFQKLLRSDSAEIRMLANVVGRDAGSVTGSNLLNLEDEFQVDPWVISSYQLAQKYGDYSVPDEDK